MPTLWLAPPSTVAVYPSGSRFEPVVLVDTVRLPVVGGGAAQLMENDVEAVPPAGTLTVREVPPLTEQLHATPDSATEWLPAESALKMTLALAPAPWLALAATA